MVKIEKSGEYLSGEFCKKNNVTKLKILDEAKEVETEFGRKLQCLVQCDDSSKSTRKWSVNNTSRNALIDRFGTDTASWKGKEIPIELVMVSTNTGMKQTIFVHN